MRRILGAVLVAVVLSPLTAQADTTGSVSRGKPLTEFFSWPSGSTVTARAVWQAKAGQQTTLRMSHLTDVNDLMSYDRLCQVSYLQASPPPLGDWSCTLSNTPAGGGWVVQFFSENGSIKGVTLTER